MVGDSVFFVGAAVEGASEGAAVGSLLGADVAVVGLKDSVGSTVVGAEVLEVGDAVGDTVGLTVGDAVGDTVGAEVFVVGLKDSVGFTVVGADVLVVGALVVHAHTPLSPESSQASLPTPPLQSRYFVWAVDPVLHVIAKDIVSVSEGHAVASPVPSNPLNSHPPLLLPHAAPVPPTPSTFIDEAIPDLAVPSDASLALHAPLTISAVMHTNTLSTFAYWALRSCIRQADCTAKGRHKARTVAFVIIKKIGYLK